jgi:diguanylate cyclase (GGDEF)-like protein
MAVVDGARVRARARGLAFLRTTWACRAWVTAAVLGAFVLPVLLVPLGHGRNVASATLTGLLLVGLSILNIEIGRLLEGGVSDSQRPHKGLSAWALAAALLLPTWWLLPVVAVTYTHAWWRGLRVTTWKWVGSAAYVVLAGLAAAIATQAVLGDETDLMQGNGLVGLLAVLAAAASFLLVEAVLFHGSAYLNHAADEIWLRQTLRSPSFYLTEAGVLLVGGLSAGIWTGGGWFVVLLAPVYLIAQRAALLEPLRERAEHDDKTRALRFEFWRRLAIAGAARCHRRNRPWCVLFADLDNFKTYNETWGHLVGDDALAVVAEAIHAELRTGDLFGRFGGEEFCVFLPDLASDDAGGIAERIRCSVSAAKVPSALPVTISVGVAAVAPAADPKAAPPGFAHVLASADRALYRAKDAGRNRTMVVDVQPL